MASLLTFMYYLVGAYIPSGVNGFTFTISAIAILILISFCVFLRWFSATMVGTVSFVLIPAIALLYWSTTQTSTTCGQELLSPHDDNSTLHSSGPDADSLPLAQPFPPSL